MEESRKKEIIISVVAILVLIVAVVGVTYAAFTFTGTGSVENTITTGTITFNYTEDTNGISLVNAQPIADSVGKVLTESDDTNGVEQGYFDFTVSSNASGNSAINYEVYGVNASPEEVALDPQYVKVYLTDGDTNETAMTGYTGVVPTFNTLITAESDATAKRLYYGTFNGTDSQKFRLRIWVSEDYNVNDISKTFIMKVNVKASA